MNKLNLIVVLFFFLAGIHFSAAQQNEDISNKGMPELTEPRPA